MHGGFAAVTGGDFLANCHKGDPGAAIVGFSPDAHFVIAEPTAAGTSLALDVKQRTAVPLIGGLRLLLKPHQVDYSYALPFIFVAPHLVLINPLKPRSKKDQREHLSSVELVSIPSGTVVSKLKLTAGLWLSPAADANFVLMLHFGRQAAAVELRSGHEVITSEQTALDVLGQFYVSERNPGEVGLYERGKGCQATVMLHKK